MQIEPATGQTPFALQDPIVSKPPKAAQGSAIIAEKEVVNAALKQQI